MAKKSTGKGRTTRESVRLMARRAEIFRRWREGRSFGAIGRSLKMSRQLVSLDCKLAIREFRDEHRASIAAQLELELDYLNEAHVELREVYESVKGKEARDPLADVRGFVDSLTSISRERRKLLGTDKPTKIEAQTTTELSVTTTFRTLDELKAQVIKRRETLKLRKVESSQ